MGFSILSHSCHSKAMLHFFVKKKLSSLTGDRHALRIVAKSRVRAFASRPVILLDEILLELDNTKRN